MPYEELGVKLKRKDNPYAALGVKLKNSSGPDRSRDVPSKLESSLRGAAQGATLGLGDEAYGVVRGVLHPMLGKGGSFSEEYARGRDLERARNEEAREANPDYYTGGELGGGLATSFVPGVAAIKGAKLAKTIGQGAGIGAVQGFGLSNAKDVSSLGEDTLGGGLTGGVTAGLFKGAGNAVNAVKKSPEKLANVFLSTPEKPIADYIRNPNALKNAPPVRDKVAQLEEFLERLKNEVTTGSKESRDLIKKSGYSEDPQVIIDFLQSRAKSIKGEGNGIFPSAQKKTDYDYYIGRINDLEKRAANVAKDPSTGFSVEPYRVPGNSIKTSVQDLDQEAKGVYNRIAGGFAPKSQLESANEAHFLRGLLEEKVPGYADEMVNVARKNRLLDDLTSLGKTEGSLIDTFKRAYRDPQGKGALAKETLEGLDKEMKSNFLEEIGQSVAKEALEKSTPNGSRLVNLGAAIGEKLPIPYGKQALAVGGAIADKYGGGISRSAVDTAARMNKIYQSKGAQAFREGMRPLVGAYKRGNPSAILTFQLLSQSNPELLQHLNDEEL